MEAPVGRRGPRALSRSLMGCAALILILSACDKKPKAPPAPGPIKATAAPLAAGHPADGEDPLADDLEESDATDDDSSEETDSED